MAERVEVFEKKDGTFDWRTVSRNENIVATSGSQGYERKIEAIRMARQQNPGLEVFEVAYVEKEPVVPEPVPPPEDDAA